MAKASDSYTIRYEGYNDLADEVERLGGSLEGFSDQIGAILDMVGSYHAVYHQLGSSVVDNLKNSASNCAALNIRLGETIPLVLRDIAATSERHEKAARSKCHWFGANGAERSGSFDHEGMADGFYAEAAAAKAPEEADQAAADAAEQQRLQEEAEAAQKAAEMAALLAAISPTAAQEYNDRIIEAQFQELMEYYKDDPVMLEKIKKDYEAWKKSRAEAVKLAESGGLSGGASDDGGLGGLGGGYGGGSDLGGLDAGGFGGGGGGLGDLGSDWAGEDWASDLLDDALDTDEFADAGAALDDVLGGAAADAVSEGIEAVGDAADLGEEAGFWGQYGSQLASVVQAYGLQAAAVAGGAVALYATREQTTEAVAHVAEFVSTKCKPAVNDVMDQVRGAAKQTRVNLGRAKSNVTAAARGERAGDLIG